MIGVGRLARRVLPARLYAPIGDAWLSLYNYRHARRVLRTYSRHYAEARRQYREAGHGAEPSCSPRAIGVLTIDPDTPPNIITLPPDYPALLDRIRLDTGERLSRTADCRLFPKPASAVLPERSGDVDDVRRGETITIQLLNYLNIDGLEALCAHVIPGIERAVYGSHVLVDKVFAYRSPVSHQRPQASWVWHYDEHPREVLKLMIYLTDVTEDTAPFTYLAADEAGTAVIGARMPLYGQSRIPASKMAAYTARGHRPRAVTGRAGTLVLFNDNVIHRATLAARGPRDVIVLQLRPDDARRAPFVDPRWTGSFQHRDFNRDPRQVTPQPWPPPARA
jgi:hypothetical protein